MKRLIAMLLSILMLMSLAPVTSLADTIVEIEDEAKIGSTYFDSFDEAVTRCETDGIIILLKDIEYTIKEEDCFTVNKSGFTLTVTVPEGRTFIEIENSEDGTSSYHDCSISYAWSPDGHTCTASAVCTHNDSHFVTETANSTGMRKTEPTYYEKGTTTYTVEFRNSLFALQTKDLEDIPILEYVIGDVNLDGKITVQDVYILRRAVAGLAILTENQKSVSDIYKDERYNSLDVNVLRRYVAELISQIPITVSEEDNAPSGSGDIVLPDDPVI